MPCDDTNTLGYAFIEYETAEEAGKAIQGMNNVAFDKVHTARVCKFDEFERLSNYPDEYCAPTMEDLENKENLRDWLTDENGRDQYVLRYASETEVWFHDPLRRGRQLQYGGEREKGHGGCWTKGQVAWSPKGSYLATFHDAGIMLWGGRDFNRMGRFGHAYVDKIEISPCEKYLVTSSADPKEVRTVLGRRLLLRLRCAGSGAGVFAMLVWGYSFRFFPFPGGRIRV